MKIAIIGSRKFPKYLYDIFANKIALAYYHDVELIISGGALKGADQFAKYFANTQNIQLLEYKANWDKYGKVAGLIRNTTIVEEADMIIAIWDGESKGTLDVIRKARKMKKDTLIMYFLNDEVNE